VTEYPDLQAIGPSSAELCDHLSHVLSQQDYHEPLELFCLSLYSILSTGILGIVPGCTGVFA
jgi:hypothetical protein